MKVRVDGFDVEADNLLVLASDDEGEGDVGTEGVPEDVSKKCEDGGGNVENEEEKELNNHTIISLVLVILPS